jgi:hypothetical protein
MNCIPWGAFGAPGTADAQEPTVPVSFHVVGASDQMYACLRVDTPKIRMHSCLPAKSCRAAQSCVKSCENSSAA